MKNNITDHINDSLIPLASVAFLVVIMLMVAAPQILTKSSFEVDLPKAYTTETKLEENITISLDENGKLVLNDKPIEPNVLPQQLKLLVKEDPFTLVIIRGDKKVEFKEILGLLTLAKGAGAQRIAFATMKKERNHK